MAASITNQQDPFSLLKNEGTVTPPSGGGALSVPPEFDLKNHAVKWAKQGPEVNQAMARDHLLGTKFSAPGWEVWKFPKTVSVRGEDGKPKNEPHPLAEQIHTVPLGNGTYVLMFRPLAVQQQVNLAYANLSRERMSMELKGETVSTPGDNQGIVTEETLLKIYGKEADADSDGNVGQAVLHGGQQLGDSNRIRPAHRVSR